MSNGSGSELIEVGAYDRITDVQGFVKSMGRSIALSKMFGVDTEAQGEILALECLSRRQPPLRLAERYHFIFGRLSMKAEAMLADFRQKMGGEYDELERSSEAAEILLKLNGKERRYRLTWEEAQKEPFVYEGKEGEVLKVLAAGKKPPIKSKYQTPRARMQMLWSRVVSDGVGAMAPEIKSGACTPDEIEDFEELQPANGKHGKVVASSPVPSATTINPTSTVVEAVVVTPARSEPQYCTGSQVAKITELLSILNPTEGDIEAMKKRRGVNAWRQLTVEQADELAGKLQQLFDQRAASAAAVSVKVNDPATEVQVTRAKQLIAEIEQSAPGFTAKLAAKLKESGLNRLVDLTVSELDSLIQQLGAKNLESFFAASLEGHAKFRPTQQASQTNQTAAA